MRYIQSRVKGIWEWVNGTTEGNGMEYGSQKASPDVIKPHIHIKTNKMQYLSSVYFVNQPLHVSGIFVAHHQEVYSIHIYIYNN